MCMMLSSLQPQLSEFSQEPCKGAALNWVTQIPHIVVQGLIRSAAGSIGSLHFLVKSIFRTCLWQKGLTPCHNPSQSMVSAEVQLQTLPPQLERIPVGGELYSSSTFH